MKVQLKNPALDKGKDSSRVDRGGVYEDDPDSMWASYRYGNASSIRYRDIGFRLVRNK